MTAEVVLSADEVRWARYRVELPEIVASRFPRQREDEMTVTATTSVEDTGLQGFRDVVRLMLANRQTEHEAFRAATVKAKGRLVDPHEVADIFTEEGVDFCSLLAVLKEPT